MSVKRLHPAFSRVPLRRRGRGFTLLEIAIAGAVVGLLAAIAVPSYAAIMERQKVEQAGRDLVAISQQIERYRTLHFAVPENLSDLGTAIPQDPWGHDYQYLNFASPAPGVAGMIRKDHNLHPLNTEFDLYSEGKDGSSMPPLTATASQDDVIWARDGGFVGLASDY
ncbi:MAG TPA: prepilin-type N-terminal cleavage/methylation domain-containing protein [Steroidobacteraceae bacterium]|nr:prepilin-type N-terminal cleavage/methylation domain-containing protein [Steroidobacteraceae bacterium]